MTRREGDRGADIERMKKSMKERKDEAEVRAKVGGREEGREGKRLTFIVKQAE